MPVPRLCLRSSSFGAVRSRAETGVEGSSSVVSDEESSSTDAEADAMEVTAGNVRSAVAISVAGLDLRLLLSQWRKIAEENLCRASRACSVNKKPRFEYF